MLGPDDPELSRCGDRQGLSAWGHTQVVTGDPAGRAPETGHAGRGRVLAGPPGPARGIGWRSSGAAGGPTQYPDQRPVACAFDGRMGTPMRSRSSTTT